MGVFDFMKSPDVNEGVKTCAKTPSAVPPDVRDRNEYTAGHIPGRVNPPLSEFASAEDRIPDADTPLFVHCLSGARSSRVIAARGEMGCTNLTNLGGIRARRGESEK